MASSRGASDSDGPDSWRLEKPLTFGPILEAALAEFHERGYHGTPVRDIARRVGVTVPALYYHHANKEAILLALLDQVTHDFIDRARVAVDDAGDDVRQQLRNVVESIALGMAWRPELARLQDEISYLSRENREEQAAIRAELESVLIEVVRRGERDGSFDVTDVRETVRAIVGMLQWISRWYVPGAGISTDGVARRYADLACRLVGVG